MSFLLATKNLRGHPNDDESNFMRSVAVSVAPIEDSVDVLSKNKQIETFGNVLSHST